MVGSIVRIRQLLAAVGVAASMALAHVAPAAAVDPVPPFIPPEADWLTTVNYYRAMAGMPAVTENATWSQGAYSHSCYMLYNDISHDEIPSNTGYTTAGDNAGNNGNVAVSSAYGTSARSHIELWMTGPFHAIGVLRHNLQTVGFGKCDLNNTPTWHSGATLNVLSGLGSVPRPSTPTLFPGNGTVTNLNQFVVESPNPLSFCGWTGSAGLPVIAMMPEAIGSVSASITGPTGPLQTCAIYSGNTNGVAQAILSGDNAVSVIPRNPLSPGTYTVNVTTQARNVTWSFTVDPTAATGVMPIPTVDATAAASGYTAVTPFRFADSRSSLRITKLLAGVPKRIHVAGTAGLPADITAVSANFTITRPTGASYLTVYNCATVAPTVSTLNFAANENVANAGIFPLSATGDLCVWSPVQTDLVLDINGHFRAASGNSYNPLTPTPLVDSDTQLNVIGRVAANDVVQVNVPDAGVNVPANATAVAINLTGANPAATGYITAYPCNITRPTVSSVNPLPGTTKSNLAIVPLSPNGELCLYTNSDVDMKVDVLGYFTAGGAGTIVPAGPARVTDTRDLYRAPMNLGTGGDTLTANQTYTLSLSGERGIPGTIQALSLNITAVRPTGNGSLTVWGCGTEPPVDSLVFFNGKTVANGVQVKVSASGDICIRSTTDTHFIIDVTGWWN